MARQRVSTGNTNSEQPAQGPSSARGPGYAKGPDGASVTPEGHGGDPTTPTPVRWVRTVEPGTGRAFYQCPQCTAQNTEEQLTKNAGECRQCEMHMPMADQADAAQADHEDARALPGQGEIPPQQERDLRKLPGAEAKPGSTPCGVCGARLTVTSLGVVCPDASTSPKHKAFAQDFATPAEKHQLRTAPKDRLQTERLEQEAKTRAQINGAVLEPEEAGHIRFTVGKITISPIEYHPFDVGPFEVVVPMGEGYEERLRKARLALHELQQLEFVEQHAAYKAFLERIYPGKGRR